MTKQTSMNSLCSNLRDSPLQIVCLPGWQASVAARATAKVVTCRRVFQERLLVIPLTFLYCTAEALVQAIAACAKHICTYRAFENACRSNLAIKTFKRLKNAATGSASNDSPIYCWKLKAPVVRERPGR